MLKTELLNSLYKNGLSNFLNKQEIEKLLTYNEIINFSIGETILQQGKESAGIYIIINGNVVVTAKILGSGTTNLETLGPGNFLGEISFIEQCSCATSVITTSQVQCLFLTRTYFELLSVFFPETKYKLFNAIGKQVIERLKKMHDKITENISSSDMSTNSLFSKIIHSLMVPTETTFAAEQFDIQHLRGSPFFHSFTAEEIEELFKHGVLLKAAKHCTLIHKGEKNASCYIVIHGAVESSIMHANKNAKLSIIGPETLFASISCIDHNSSFTVTFATCEQCILFKLSETDLDYFIKNNSVLWCKIFYLICRSLVALEKSVDKLDIRLSIEIYNR